MVLLLDPAKPKFHLPRRVLALGESRVSGPWKSTGPELHPSVAPENQRCRLGIWRGQILTMSIQYHPIINIIQYHPIINFHIMKNHDVRWSWCLSHPLNNTSISEFRVHPLWESNMTRSFSFRSAKTWNPRCRWHSFLGDVNSEEFNPWVVVYLRYFLAVFAENISNTSIGVCQSRIRIPNLKKKTLTVLFQDWDSFDSSIDSNQPNHWFKEQPLYYATILSIYLYLRYT